ncbi:MAG: hypothetical protein R6T90_02395 [Dissulfuribacterales bacterium]
MSQNLSNPSIINEQTIGAYNYSGITINEQFRPLIGIDITLKNNLTARFQLKKSRTLSLSFSNNRLTETKSDEFVFGTGYRFDKVKLIIGKPIESDLNLSADISIRDNKTLFRDLDGAPPQPSTGQKTIAIKTSADYAISNNFTIRVFAEQNRNTPLVSNSYPTRNTNIGFSLRFTLTQ